MTMTSPAAAPVPTRTCGSCTLCCKVYKIPALPKPAGQWCSHCKPGKGCGIYPDRPEQCRTFLCLWLSEATMPDIWKPERSKMVLSNSPETGFLHVQVDPGQPSAWMREPYRSQLANWSARFLKEGSHILVFVNDHATLIMPTEAISLGSMNPSEGFVVRQGFNERGPTYLVERVQNRPLRSPA
jgi:hypothetical protein